MIWLKMDIMCAPIAPRGQLFSELWTDWTVGSGIGE